MTTKMLMDVGRALDALSDNITGFSVEYPGFLRVRVDGAVWHIGTAAGVWGADFYINEEDEGDNGFGPSDSVETTVGPEAPADVAARALYDAMVAFDSEQEA